MSNSSVPGLRRAGHIFLNDAAPGSESILEQARSGSDELPPGDGTKRTKPGFYGNDQLGGGLPRDEGTIGEAPPAFGY